MTERSYDSIADWYDEYVKRQPIYSEEVLPNLVRLVGDVQGQRVCDVACGQGLASRELAKAGVRVTGIDLSEPLLALARQYETSGQLGIEYVLDDAQALSSQADETFDGATCCMALMNIPDLTACLQSVRRILKPDGWFVFCITHPCFETPNALWIEQDGQVSRVVRGYFEERYWVMEGGTGVRSRVGDWHRMVSTYVNSLVDTGFVIERMLEPQATGKRAEQVPGNREIPNLLLIRARAA